MARQNYSQNLKDQAFKMYQNGLKISEIAQSLNVKYQNVYYWIHQASIKPSLENPSTLEPPQAKLNRLEKQIEELEKSLQQLRQKQQELEKESKQKDLIIAAQRDTFIQLKKALAPARPKKKSPNKK